MIPTIKKILFACDLTTNWEYTLAYAVSTSLKHNAEMVLLHVIEPFPQGARMWMDLYVSDQDKENVLHHYRETAIATMQEKIKPYVQDTETQLKISMITTEEGYPADVILSKIKELDCDLIVMGNHGKGLMTHAFLGSVAERVVRRVKKPILIVPHP